MNLLNTSRSVSVTLVHGNTYDVPWGLEGFANPPKDFQRNFNDIEGKIYQFVETNCLCTLDFLDQVKTKRTFLFCCNPSRLIFDDSSYLLSEKNKIEKINLKGSLFDDLHRLSYQMAHYFLEGGELKLTFNSCEWAGAVKVTLNLGVPHQVVLVTPDV